MNYALSKIPPLETNKSQPIPVIISDELNQSFSNNDFGILQFNPDFCQEPPKFTEPFTIDAMQRLGITPEELMKLTDEEKEKIPGDEKVKNQNDTVKTKLF